MKLLILTVLLTMLLTGCSVGNKTAINDKGICDGLAPRIDSLNDALLIDGGPRTIVAGENVISGFDAGCYGTMVK